jgi:hypothetical protein
MCTNLSANDAVRIVLHRLKDEADGEHHQGTETILTVIEDDLNIRSPDDRRNARIDPDQVNLAARWVPGGVLATLGGN